MIYTSLSPNTQPDDIALAWNVLLHPNRWHGQIASQKAAQTLSMHTGGSFVVFTSSGRSALEILLRALGITAGDEVIMQAFTCIAVPEPVLWRRARPVYADILPRQYTMNPDDVAKKITKKTKAIIIQHTFGMPAHSEAVKQLAASRNLFVIEDCAHALGSTYKNQPLGTFGDAAIYSFGRDKCLSSVFGGAIAVKNTGLLSNIQTIARTYKPAPASWVAQQLLHPVIFNAALSLYGKFGLGQGIIYLSQQAGFLSKAVTQAERLGSRPPHIAYRYPEALAHLLVNQLAKLQEYTNRRQALAQRYFTGLSSLGFSLPKVIEESRPAWLRFPLLVKNRAGFLSGAGRSGIFLGDWYDAPLVPKNSNLMRFQYTLGSCPQAEDAAAHVINLPTHPRLTDREVDQIIEFTKAHAEPYYQTK
ncbi:MAG: DegT/DnrJ/EryC1/StrS aminotransferase family protein [Candidatus Andersenbacteria bacterium]|nr:DegT/DnrJ/EryC1/StrS aminotransferase family protein [Candidatus Andersenbacteria bacterium]